MVGYKSGIFNNVSGLRVISPTTANVYKNVDMSVPDIALP